MQLLKFQPQINHRFMNSNSDYSEPVRRINDALAIRKFCASSHAIQATAIYDLRSKLLCIQDAFMEQARANLLDFALDFSGAIPVAYWDINTLSKEVFSLLVAKAVEYTPLGGKVIFSAHQLDNYHMAIRIGDAGSGIRGSGITPSDFNVCGHELNNALLCVLAHQGTMKLVKTEEFDGAVFEIVLPLYALCMQ